MAKSKLSSAYKSAASSSGSYRASLYDIENIGYERNTSAQLAGIKAQDKNRMVGMISEGLDLAGNVIRKGQRRKEMGKAAESLGAISKDKSLWGKLTGEEQMYEVDGTEVSGSDVMAEYKLSQAEKAFGRDKTTGKKTSTSDVKKLPTIPEAKPNMAKEANISKVQGPPAPKTGLNVTVEELKDWKTSSGFFDESSDKGGLTQYANWKNSGSPKRDKATIKPMPGIMNY
tara:strand:- start:1767 stop:2453 length:687 start_codon:yes stop_codon:yes gene_type:complete